MGKSIFILLSFFVLVSCKSKEEQSVNTDLVNNPATADSVNANKEDLPIMTFDQDLYDFGEIIQGEVATYNFRFTNSGKSELLISSARASCGCTVPEYPEEPIKPGDSAIIKVSYNSEGRKDAFNKTVTITANTYPSENKLQIKGIVIVPKN